MTFGSQQPGRRYGWSPPPGQPYRWSPAPRRFRWWFVAAGVAVLVGFAVAIPVVAGHHNDRGYRAGDCVLVASAISGELRATETGCDTDTSFTVAKLADATGNCIPEGYDQFRPPSADPVTGRLCLVPNLAAGHCYRIGVTVGMWQVQDCASPGPAVVRVTERLDVDDAGACPSETHLPARSYPSPPRTYCLGLAT